MPNMLHVDSASDLAPQNQANELATRRTTLLLQESWGKPEKGRGRLCNPPSPDHDYRRRWKLHVTLNPTYPLIKDARLILSKSSQRLKLVRRHISASFLIVLRSNFTDGDQSDQRAAAPLWRSGSFSSESALASLVCSFGKSNLHRLRGKAVGV